MVVVIAHDVMDAMVTANAVSVRIVRIEVSASRDNRLRKGRNAGRALIAIIARTKHATRLPKNRLTRRCLWAAHQSKRHNLKNRVNNSSRKPHSKPSMLNQVKKAMVVDAVVAVVVVAVAIAKVASRASNRMARHHYPAWNRPLSRATRIRCRHTCSTTTSVLRLVRSRWYLRQRLSLLKHRYLHRHQRNCLLCLSRHQHQRPRPSLRESRRYRCCHPRQLTRPHQLKPCALSPPRRSTRSTMLVRCALHLAPRAVAIETSCQVSHWYSLRP